ncbi:nicotinate phosphoribosyltransferase [Ceratobasidium sp. 423]|nr:nicotinate phosphoribosyltransferase [Ceratobasidium sp. 423]
MDLWEATYPTIKSNVLHIAPTDTFSTDVFTLVKLLSFSENIESSSTTIQNFKTDASRAERWRGLRQDSGDPFTFIPKVRAAYEQMGIDYRKKVLVFSDSLDVELAVKLQKAVDKAGFIGEFVIGTFFTNHYKRVDNELRSQPFNMVIKLVSVEGTPCVKIGDDITRYLVTAELDKVLAQMIKCD